jgi:hypothetical protein
MRRSSQVLILAMTAIVMGCGQQTRYETDTTRPPTLDERQTGPIFQPRPPVPPNPATGSAPAAQP